jgi:AmmeMemoRadiSam system protein A
MAIAAGFEDPRFGPVEAREDDALEIEISVLSRPRPWPLEELVAGLHGVSLESHGHRAVFLPQVAREEGWSRRVLLEQLSLKAGLDPDAWKHPDVRVECFTAEVFSEPRRSRG